LNYLMHNPDILSPMAVLFCGIGLGQGVKRPPRRLVAETGFRGNSKSLFLATENKTGVGDIQNTCMTARDNFLLWKSMNNTLR
jgi:hypothetical protein